MLPSGNDASLVLAENFGRLELFDACRFHSNSIRRQCEHNPTDAEYNKLCVSHFVKRMNKEAKKLQMQ